MIMILPIALCEVTILVTFHILTVCMSEDLDAYLYVTCRGGSRGVGGSLKQGVWEAQPPRSYRVFYSYNTKITRFGAYLSKYKEIYN